MDSLLKLFFDNQKAYRGFESALYELGQLRNKEIFALRSQYNKDSLTLTLPSKWLETAAKQPTSFVGVTFATSDRHIADHERDIWIDVISIAKDMSVYVNGDCDYKFLSEKSFEPYNNLDDVFYVVNSRYDMLIPWEGWFSEYHPLFERAANFAETLASETNPHLRKIRGLDKDIHERMLDKAALTILTEDAVKRSCEVDTLDAVANMYLDLKHIMEHHDWTWKYADRFIHSASENEDKMYKMLKELPLNHRIAMWLRYSYNAMSFYPFDKQ